MSEAVIIVRNEYSIVETEDADIAVFDREKISVVSEQVQGISGTSGGLKFVHTQAIESSEWTVNHNLGEKPMTEIRDGGGQRIGAKVLHVSVNQLKVYLTLPVAGEVRCL